MSKITGPRVLNYDFNRLAKPPFTVYFYDDNGQIHPKRMFTVTKKVINHEKQKIELFIKELNRVIDYDPKYVRKSVSCEVN